MKAQQIVLPFKLIRGEALKANPTSDDLIGRRYFDGTSDVIITNLCRVNPKHVVVRRELDGKTWAVPAWVICLIVGAKKKKRRVA